MNDDLKFRVWCRDRNEWEKHECMLCPGGIVIHFNSRGIQTLLRPQEHIVERCIGIPDRNKNLIYAGDVVEVEMMCDIPDGVTEGFSRAEKHKNGVYYFTKIRGAVEWKYAEFFVKLIDRKTNFDASFYDHMGDKFGWEQLEVIGNIHENPEFL